MSDHLGRAWRAYADQQVPLQASPRELADSRRSFFAGAAALLGLLLTQEYPGGDPLGMRRELGAELAHFAEDLAAGKA